MSEKKQQYSKFFHGFMIYFALWAFAAFAILYGIKFIYEGQMNGYEGFDLVMLIIVNALLIGLGLFAIKVRFDLAGYKEKAPKEILWICIIGAVLCLANYWVEDIAGDDFNRSLLSTAFILAVWGFGVYRYYRLHADLFVN
ncbi:MAG: hypothetical protein IK133_06110 [Clostridia bacterium]|nr:hypothetical protein [Clostridia bacterium]MBR5383381.1 hypothetical protein [Clostridia bacterium]